MRLDGFGLFADDMAKMIRFEGCTGETEDRGTASDKEDLSVWNI